MTSPQQKRVNTQPRTLMSPTSTISKIHSPHVLAEVSYLNNFI